MNNPLVQQEQREREPLDLDEKDPEDSGSATLSTRANQVAHVVLALNVAFLAVFVVAWMFGWFSLSMETSDSGETQVVMALSPSEMSADVRRGMTEMGKATESLVTATEQKSTQGKIINIDADAKMITVASREDEKLTISVNGITDVQDAGNEADFDALVEERYARIVYKENDGELFALKIKQFAEDAAPIES